MPDLAMQIFNHELATSLIGNMLFPNDPAEAMAAASWYLDGKLVNAPIELVRTVDESIIWGVRAAARNYSKEAGDAAYYRGTQVGYIVSYLWHASQTGISATLEDAIRAAEKSAGVLLPGSRTSFMAAKSEFSKVLHFWAILSSEYQNRWPSDPSLFISKSESFLREMRNRRIAGETFHSPKFTIPVTVYDWPVSGQIRFGTLPPALLPVSKKRAGRPRKIPVQR